jgi:hypothetical protein
MPDSKLILSKPLFPASLPCKLQIVSNRSEEINFFLKEDYTKGGGFCSRKATKTYNMKEVNVFLTLARAITLLKHVINSFVACKWKYGFHSKHLCIIL